MAQGTTPPFPRALVDPATGRLTREGYTFLVTLNTNSSEAAAGSVTTAPGSGLQGGGAVSDGISLSIANNGVSNAMIRQGLGTSVIGRAFGSTGNVADIQSVQDFTVLTRESDQLAFRPELNGVGIGTDTAAPLVRCDAFRIDQTPTAEVVVCTHTITISVDGVDYKLPCVAA